MQCQKPNQLDVVSVTHYENAAFHVARKSKSAIKSTVLLCVIHNRFILFPSYFIITIHNRTIQSIGILLSYPIPQKFNWQANFMFEPKNMYVEFDVLKQFF